MSARNPRLRRDARNPRLRRDARNPRLRRDARNPRLRRDARNPRPRRGEMSVDARTLERIGRLVEKKKGMIRLSLQACAHCALCAESCFKFRQSGGDPTYTPSYKAINSIGRIWRRKGRLSEAEYERIRELVWDKCVLCMRCYCPIGISIPSLIAVARGACRERGVQRWYTTRRNA